MIFCGTPAGDPEKLNPLEILPELGAGILGMPLESAFRLGQPGNLV